ncbi:MAG: glycosyltransferase family 2 protein, partial [Saprospiraceae bacterium]|nr:glycosyltransferase family 2 protein [Saprospiraceae bacterium]
MDVSLIIPVFNSFDYIDECIASVIQFPEIKEIICIDDKSSDGSLEKLQHWASLEKRIIVLENKGLQGCGPSRNMGIEESTCEFIAFLDSDDYFFPNRFYSDKDIFIEFPWIEGVSNAIVRSDNLIIGPKTHGRLLTFKNYINGDTVSFTGLTLRKSVFSKIGVFNEDFLLGQDVIFHSKLLEECKIISGNVSEPVAFYRIHNNNSTK